LALQILAHAQDVVDDDDSRRRPRARPAWPCRPAARHDRTPLDVPSSPNVSQLPDTRKDIQAGRHSSGCSVGSNVRLPSCQNPVTSPTIWKPSRRDSSIDDGRIAAKGGRPGFSVRAGPETRRPAVRTAPSERSERQRGKFKTPSAANRCSRETAFKITSSPAAVVERRLGR
jgi:hypothetical protein